MSDTNDQNNNEQEEDVSVLINKAELDPAIPKIYFNEIAGVCNHIDNTLLLGRKGVVQAVIYMSIPTAKDLVNKVGGILVQQEQMMEEDKNEQNNEENSEI